MRAVASIFLTLLCACGVDDFPQAGDPWPPPSNGVPVATCDVPTFFGPSQIDLTCEKAPELCTGQLAVLHEGSWDGPLLDLVFVPEAFTDEQLPAYREQVEALTRSLLDEQDGFSSYRERFRVHRLDIASRTSNIGNADIQDTVFGGCLNPALSVSYLVDLERVYFAALTKVPSTTVIILVANTDTREARAMTYTSTQDEVAAVKLTRLGGAGTLAHELAHALLFLGDEYSAGSRPTGSCFPAEALPFTTGDIRVLWPNVTLDPEGRRWSDTIQGAEEGGLSYTCGVYNPPGECKMEHSSAASFCAVCRHQMDAFFLAQEGRNDGLPRCEFGLTQAPATLRGTVGVHGRFEDRNGLREWSLRVDSVPVASKQLDGGFRRWWLGELNLEFDSLQFANGPHRLQLECIDSLGSTSVTEADVTFVN